MTRGPAEGSDALSCWLAGEGPRSLDFALSSAPDVVGVLDRELTIRYVNWTGPSVTRDAVVGQSALALAPPEYRDVARAVYENVLATGNRGGFELTYGDGAAARLWVVRVGPIRVEGAIVGLIAITSDVAEERRLHVDRDRFFSLSLDLLIVASPEGHLKRLNPAFAAALGCDVSELLAQPFIDWVHPDDRERTLEAFSRVLGGTPNMDFENRYRRRDGAYRVFSWRATVDPITGDCYAVARDVTDHRVAEAQLRHAQKMEAVGQLAGGIAHDFNNLLLAILANAELGLHSVPLSAELTEHLRDIDGAARRAADLTKQLLAFSRRQPLHPVPLDLNRLIAGLMQILRRLLPESISIDLVAGDELASVLGDAGQLEQVVVNLCVNARDAMARGGHLTIKTENVVLDEPFCEAHPWAKAGRYVLLSVEDDGVGMTAEVRERAFEPFFTTKSPLQGSGLGLSTVYGIVQQHGGMIHLDTEPGSGTTFETYLPTDARPAVRVPDQLELRPAGGRETILLAEDEEPVRRVLTQILERAGYRTIAVGNGLEATRILRERRDVKLVILDIVMPGQGGPEAWEQIRELCPGLGALFMSGYADSRYRQQLPPNVEVLEKPFRTEALLAAVRRALDAGSKG